jgi:FMN reductase (NADPH)
LQAPVLLTFCADFQRFDQWCRQRNAEPGYDNFLSFITAAIDALLAAQNVALAAEDKGLGICYLGTTIYNADKLVEFFKCPEGVVPITTIVLGYPDENPGLTDRLPYEAIVHNEVYSKYSPEKIDDLYREKEELPLTKSLIVENQLENLAQIFTQKRYTKKDIVYFSKSFLSVIKQQGFMNNEE